MEFKAV